MYKMPLLRACPRILLISLLVVAISATGIIPAYAEPGLSSDPNNENGRVQLIIVKIECLDQNEWPGSDEIWLGGTAASKYGVDKINYRNLGTFQTGDVDESEWVFTEIPVTEITDYTRMQLSLVEEDFGGKDEHIEELVLKEHELVQTAMIAYFIEQLEQIGATADGRSTQIVSFGIVLAATLKLAARFAFTQILEEFWGDLIGDFDDEIFKPENSETPIDQLVANPNDRITGTITLQEHSAEYRITYAWQWVEDPESTRQVLEYQPYLSFDETVEQLRWLWNHRYKVFLPMISN